MNACEIGVKFNHNANQNGKTALETNMGMHIIIYRNPVDGFGYIGPFKTADDALTYAGEKMESDWWIAPLEAAEKE